MFKIIKLSKDDLAGPNKLPSMTLSSPGYFGHGHIDGLNNLYIDELYTCRDVQLKRFIERWLRKYLVYYTHKRLSLDRAKRTYNLLVNIEEKMFREKSDIQMFYYKINDKESNAISIIPGNNFKYSQICMSIMTMFIRANCIFNVYYDNYKELLNGFSKKRTTSNPIQSYIKRSINILNLIEEFGIKNIFTKRINVTNNTQSMGVTDLNDHILEADTLSDINSDNIGTEILHKNVYSHPPRKLDIYGKVRNSILKGIKQTK